VSPTRRGLRDDLTRLGDRAATGPSFGFTARLERQLVGRVEALAGATLLALPRRHRRLLPAITVAAATAAGVLLAGALLGAFGDRKSVV
jgi:hypothetical protein